MAVACSHSTMRGASQPHRALRIKCASKSSDVSHRRIGAKVHGKAQEAAVQMSSMAMLIKRAMEDAIAFVEWALMSGVESVPADI